MSIKSMFMAFAALLLAANTLTAQTPATKFGHMNLGNLVEVLPDSKKAGETIEAFTKPIAARVDSMGKALESAAAELQSKYQAGELTQIEAQKRYEAIQKDQAFFDQYQKTAQQQVDAKREELLTPILTKVDDAIKAVAKENGYLMIFDTSTGSMLYALETEDVTALVKKKLGI